MSSQPESRNQTEVIAVHGADPEVMAYAMAKYSRSALSMREALAEISAQRAEQFLNTFYFQYGHRSIADLAHVAFAVERLSLIAAIELVDEQRWDGQERSTRYQNFMKTGWYLPEFGSDTASESLYKDVVHSLFEGYEYTTCAVLEALKKRIARPADVDEGYYNRTLKARAFDVSRYLLPLATNTSLGQIVNARTLETQVSRLLAHPAAEVRDLGKKLREAATGAAWDVNLKAREDLIEKMPEELRAEAAELLAREVKTAPTLVKYAEPNEYLKKTRGELEVAARELLGAVPPSNDKVVDLVERTESFEVELAATLLYSASHHSYRQIRDCVAGLSAARVAELVELGLKHRGRHDEALRAFHAGAALRFDILMDVGGFRDMHRHRRCTQIIQGMTTVHGYELPDSGDLGEGDILEAAGVKKQFVAALNSAHAASTRIAAGHAPEAAETAKYVLPLATKVRSLFKMDYAEAQYITELRSGPAGHFSYRRVAWLMFKEFEQQHPELAKYFRVTDFTQPIDLLKR